MKKLLIIALLTLSIVFPFTTHAQANPITQIFKVTPIIIDTKLNPDKPNQYEIKIDNLLESPLGISASLEDFAPADESISPAESALLSKSPLPKWATLSEQQILIDQDSYKTITLTLTPPPGTKEGGYYATLFLTPFFSKQTDPHVPKILSKVGVLVLATIGDQKAEDRLKKSSITRSSISKLNETAVPTLSLSVKNDYFTHFSAKPFVTITPLFGKPQRIEVEEKHILPGRSRFWKQKLDIKSKYNFYYKAQIAVSVGEGKEHKVNTYFLVLPWKSIGIPLIAGLIIIAVALLRKRVVKAIKQFSKALFHKQNNQ